MKKILVPCDFSDPSENALNYAAELAKYLTARLVLLHVDQWPVMSPEMSLSMYPPLQDMKQESLDALHNLVGKIRLTHHLDADIEYHSETGSTPDVILELVDKLNVDLIVMGISGHGSAFMKNLVGSSSVDVASQTDVPVIIVPPQAAYHKVQNIAYACDFREDLESSASLIRVKYLATLFDAMLLVVHMVPEGHKMSPQETGAGNFVERSLENAPHKTYIITENNTSQGLLNFIRTHQVDLVIVEPRKHSFIHKIFSGSTTKDIVFNSPVPVLTIHEKD